MYRERGGRNGRREDEEEEEGAGKGEGEHWPGEVAPGLICLSIRRSSLRLLLIMRHGAIVAPPYAVYYRCLFVFVSAWVATAHGSRVKRAIPQTRLGYSSLVPLAAVSPRIIARGLFGRVYRAPSLPHRHRWNPCLRVAG